jgi:soluble lytic murein transglycosylase-like protein
MHGTRRRQAPWEREREAPAHPVGRARRRFPAAAGAPPERYRRAFDGAGDQVLRDGDRRRADGVRLPRKQSAMDRFRRHPMRHGMLGLAVAGAATPLAISRSNQMRTAPEHEVSLLPEMLPKVSDLAVGEAWRVAEADIAEAKTSEREQVIARNLERFASYDIPRQLAEEIYDLAIQEEVDPDVAFGLVRAESSFKNSATSHVGAVGLTQLMPRTAAWIKPGVTVKELRDSRTNLQIGFKYLNDLMAKYDGDTHLALLAYNRGPGTVDRVLKRGGDPDNGYPDMVLRDTGSKRAPSS